jgi:hypothetical protein
MKRLLIACATVLCLSGVASASVILDLVSPTGVDSGWSAVFDQTRTDVIVDSVTSTYLRVEVFKNFTSDTPNVITFMPRLPTARKLIQITDETIVNNTGWDWTDYHWQIEGSNAAFDSNTTGKSGWSIAPFTQSHWSGWVSGGFYDELSADGGVVEADGIFTPGLVLGRLDINTAVAPLSAPAEFQLEQYPTPEPATLTLLGLGAAALIHRRRIRGASR